MLQRDECCIYRTLRGTNDINVEVSIEWEYAPGHGATFKFHRACSLSVPRTFLMFLSIRKSAGKLTRWSRIYKLRYFPKVKIFTRWNFLSGSSWEIFWAIEYPLFRFHHWRITIFWRWSGTSRKKNARKLVYTLFI